MSSTYLKRDQRVTTIIQAASQLVVEGGLEAATVTAIAHRAGVSRQWLYELFPDVDAILTAMYEQSVLEYFPALTSVTPEKDGYPEYVKVSVERYLTMPTAFAVVISAALHQVGETASLGVLRDRILHSFDVEVVTPLEQAGFDRNNAFASVIAVAETAAGLNIAIARGLTTLEAAKRTLGHVVDAVTRSISTLA